MYAYNSSGDISSRSRQKPPALLLALVLSLIVIVSSCALACVGFNVGISALSHRLSGSATTTEPMYLTNAYPPPAGNEALYSTPNGITAQNPRTSQILWSYPVNVSAYGFVSDGARVYFLGQITRQNMLGPIPLPTTHTENVIGALDARTGAVRWLKAAPNSVGGIIVNNGHVFVALAPLDAQNNATNQLETEALAATDGAMLWNKTRAFTDSTFTLEANQSIVFEQSTSGVYAYQVSTGATLWKAFSGDKNGQTAVGLPISGGDYVLSASLLLVTEDCSYLGLLIAGPGLQGICLSGVNPATGVYLWSTQVSVTLCFSFFIPICGGADIGPVDAAGTAYVISQISATDTNGNTYDTAQIKALSERTGASLWEDPIPVVYQSPTKTTPAPSLYWMLGGDSQTLYYFSDIGDLTAFSLQSHSPLWSTQTNWTQKTATNGIIPIFAEAQGIIYLSDTRGEIAIQASDGSIEWRSGSY